MLLPTPHPEGKLHAREWMGSIVLRLCGGVCAWDCVREHTTASCACAALFQSLNHSSAYPRTTQAQKNPVSLVPRRAQHLAVPPPLPATHNIPPSTMPPCIVSCFDESQTAVVEDEKQHVSTKVVSTKVALLGTLGKWDHMAAVVSGFHNGVPSCDAQSDTRLGNVKKCRTDSTSAQRASTWAQHASAWAQHGRTGTLQPCCSTRETMHQMPAAFCSEERGRCGTRLQRVGGMG